MVSLYWLNSKFVYKVNTKKECSKIFKIALIEKFYAQSSNFIVWTMFALNLRNVKNFNLKPFQVDNDERVTQRHTILFWHTQEKKNPNHSINKFSVKMHFIFSMFWIFQCNLHWRTNDAQQFGWRLWYTANNHLSPVSGSHSDRCQRSDWRCIRKHSARSIAIAKHIRIGTR